MSATALLAAENLSVVFAGRSGRLSAVAGASLEVGGGETVALVGESGSGKSTLALTMVGAYQPRHGRVLFEGQDLARVDGTRRRDFRRQVQMVFQDPYASLDPRMTVARIVDEPLRAHGVRDGSERRRRVLELLERVGLDASAADRRPAHFSGGQRQRIAVARALAVRPRLVVADEPVSSLDVSVQAQIVNLLRELQDELSVSYLLVSHDLPLVHHLARRVAVMYLGRLVEQGPVEDVVRTPQHPYTAALLSASPNLDPSGARLERILLAGSPPSPLQRPSGCEFHPRCPVARDRCRTEAPAARPVSPTRQVACFYPGELPGVEPVLATQATRARRA